MNNPSVRKLKSVSCFHKRRYFWRQKLAPWDIIKHLLLLLLLSCFSCVQLCDPIDGSPPDSSVPWILQARILEWVAISFSNACMHAKSLQLCLTQCDPMDSSPPPGSSVHRFSRQEDWSGLPFPSPNQASRLLLLLLFLTRDFLLAWCLKQFGLLYQKHYSLRALNDIFPHSFGG